MSPSGPSAGSRVGLALVDPIRFDPDLFAELSAAGVNATFFVRPSVLVLESDRWRFARAAGHELGVGCLLGSTDDGRLPNWTCDTIDSELKECAKLLRELGESEAVSVYLPGRFHLCAEGRYRRRLQQRFPICIGEARRSASLHGVYDCFDVLSLPAIPRDRATVFCIPADASRFRRLLPLAATHRVVPLRELLAPSSHT